MSLAKCPRPATRSIWRNIASKSGKQTRGKYCACGFASRGWRLRRSRRHSRSGAVARWKFPSFDNPAGRRFKRRDAPTGSGQAPDAETKKAQRLAEKSQEWKEVKKRRKRAFDPDLWPSSEGLTRGSPPL